MQVSNAASEGINAQDIFIDLTFFFNGIGPTINALRI